MTTQFYRKKNKKTGRDDFYTVGTDEHISPSQFGNGSGYSEKPVVAKPVENNQASSRLDAITNYANSPSTSYRGNQSFLETIKEAIRKKQGYNEDIKSSRNYWRTQQRDPMTFTDERFRLMKPEEQQAIREKRYAVAGANLAGLRDEEKYRESTVADMLKSVAGIQDAQHKDDVMARQKMMDEYNMTKGLMNTGYKYEDGKISRDYSDVTAEQLAAAIKQHESGGNYNASGGSGESGAFQYTEPTWAQYSGEYTKDKLGQAQSLAPTPANQDAVTVYKIQKWMDSGYTPEQIASMWNAGQGRPDAYKQNWRGTNKYGVKYDTPAYVDSVMGLLGKTSPKKHKFWTERAVEGLAEKTGQNPTDLWKLSDDELSKLARGNGLSLAEMTAKNLLKTPRQIISIGLPDESSVHDILVMKYDLGESKETIEHYMQAAGIPTVYNGINVYDALMGLVDKL